MKKYPVTVVLLISLCLVFPPVMPSAQGDPDYPHLSLPDFLQQAELSFDEYITLVKEYETNGVYTHYLEKNASRYEAFQKNNPDIPNSTAIAYVNVNVDYGQYTNIQEVDERDLDSITVLINKNFALPAGWAAEDMVTVSGGELFREQASEYLLSLCNAVGENGGKIYIEDTYRSYNDSHYLHSRAVNNYGQEIADLNWARGGHSEHQTGLAADVLHISGYRPLTEARFETTGEYNWMRENAHNYGFILRYPAEYEHIHGYKFEPWHWRFVGIDIATVMYEDNIVVYEEFYGKYLASDVLYNVKSLIEEKRAQEEAAETARLEREEAERLAAEAEAQAAAEKAALQAQAEIAAQEEAARLAAQREEEERLAALLKAEEEEKESRRQTAIMISVIIGCVLVISAVGVGMYKSMQKRKAKN